MSIELIIFAVLVVLSAFFSASETAFSSINRVRIKHLANSGNKNAKRVLVISKKFESFLSTILIGNNIVNLAGASLMTAYFIIHIGEFGTTVATIVTTVVVLIFGEIVPKTIAKEIPERFSMVVAPIIRLLMWLLVPINFFFKGLKYLISKIFKTKNDVSITEEELITLVDEASKEGSINDNETELIKKVFRFDEEIVETILTPRMKIEAVDINDDKKHILEVFKKSGFSRLPVYDKEIDNIVGIINHKDFYNYVLLGNDDLKNWITIPRYVPPTMKIGFLLAELRENKAHIAVVLDEYNGTVGIVTLEDIIEEIVGDIWDEHDKIVQSVIKITNNLYTVKGQADISLLANELGTIIDTEQLTFNGYAQEFLGKIPVAGDTFIMGEFRITVTKAGNTKLEEAKVERLANDEISVL